MKVFVMLQLALVMTLVNASYLYAQSSDADYIEMRDKAKVLFDEGKYSSALQMYDGAAGFVSDINNREELNRLRSELRDSVKAIYNHSVLLARNAVNKRDYSDAIQSFKQLIPIDGLNVPSFYSWIGICYEHLDEPYAAMEQYEKGVAHGGEYYSAWQLAKMLPKYRTVTDDEIIRLYEIAAKHESAVYDDLGDFVVGKTPQKAYEYYKKSDTRRGRYQIASLILSKKIYAKENAVQILKRLSDEKYADAQFYLGLLYFQGNDEISRNTSVGLELIKLAAAGGCKDAIKWLQEREREMYRYY